VNYALTKDTILLYPKETATGVSTIVYEKERVIEVMDTPKKIIRDNCLMNGSNLEGRKAHSRKLINVHCKIPIIIKELDKMIVFPLRSIRKSNCGWINFSNHRLIKYISDGKFVISSVKEYEITLDVSRQVISNQVQKSALLYCEYFK
jgi:competence protein ComK